MDPTQALADMRTTASRGEVAGSWDNVVKTYQQAGQQGASVVGPAIDQLSGGSPQTTTLTHRAWTNNGLLAALNSSPNATKDDADQAKRFVDSMLSDLQTALNIAKANPHPLAVAANIIASQQRAYSPPVYSAAPAYTPPQQQPPPQQPAASGPQIGVKEVGGAALGAALGMSVGGPVGAIAGAIVGGVVGHMIPKS